MATISETGGSFFTLPTSSAATRRRYWFLEGQLGFLAPLPTDSLYNIALTFDGVVAGAEIRAYLQSDGTELFGVESCDADHAFAAAPYYGPGMDVTIRIVHPDYRIKEFPYTVPAASQSIPIQMEADKWYSNPA